MLQKERDLTEIKQQVSKRLSEIEIRKEETTDSINAYLHYFYNQAVLPRQRLVDRAFAVDCTLIFGAVIISEVINHPWRPRQESQEFLFQVLDEFEKAAIAQGIVTPFPPVTNVPSPRKRAVQVKEILGDPDSQTTCPIPHDQIILWAYTSPAKLMGLGAVARDEQGTITHMFYIKDVLFADEGPMFYALCDDGQDDDEDIDMDYTPQMLSEVLGELKCCWFRPN
ncbi:hypothetical protein H0H92_015329 [Tricholoma furcatifolium]|nr:hypothetical protein H0H92_015329 [Tricholoma furcatifolium]